jgi:hypothetical protein
MVFAVLVFVLGVCIVFQCFRALGSKTAAAAAKLGFSTRFDRLTRRLWLLILSNRRASV